MNVGWVERWQKGSKKICCEERRVAGTVWKVTSWQLAVGSWQSKWVVQTGAKLAEFIATPCHRTNDPFTMWHRISPGGRDDCTAVEAGP
jgi:hypothetical protein